MTFTLTGLAVGLGTLYPNFKEENPARCQRLWWNILSGPEFSVYSRIVVLLALASPWSAISSPSHLQNRFMPQRICRPFPSARFGSLRWECAGCGILSCENANGGPLLVGRSRRGGKGRGWLQNVMAARPSLPARSKAETAMRYVPDAIWLGWEASSRRREPEAPAVAADRFTRGSLASRSSPNRSILAGFQPRARERVKRTSLAHRSRLRVRTNQECLLIMQREEGYPGRGSVDQERVARKQPWSSGIEAGAAFNFVSSFA